MSVRTTKKRTMSVGIIMPAFNAERTIVRTIRRIPVKKTLKTGISPTLYIVNDGSKDGTAELMDTCRELVPFSVRVLNHAVNKGYGASQKTGLSRSLRDGNQFHVLLHADGQYAPEELPDILAPLLSGTADVVIGSKFRKGQVLAQGMPFVRMLGIRFFDRVENLLFGSSGLEFHSGYMGYTSSVLHSVPFREFTDKFHFDGQMVAGAALRRKRITMVPIRTRYGNDVSSLHAVPYIFEILGILLRYLFFGKVKRR